MRERWARFPIHCKPIGFGWISFTATELSIENTIGHSYPVQISIKRVCDLWSEWFCDTFLSQHHSHPSNSHTQLLFHLLFMVLFIVYARIKKIIGNLQQYLLSHRSLWQYLILNWVWTCQYSNSERCAQTRFFQEISDGDQIYFRKIVMKLPRKYYTVHY